MAQYCDNFKFSENNQDHFVMGPVSNDTFQFWQGLRGPYFTPSVDEDGVLSWTNNGQLPNPEPVRIVGKDGRGITLTGQCATVAELPEDPEQGEAWAVGAEEPFECYAWFGEWVDMGLLFPAGQDGVSPAVTITTTATGHKVKITDRDHPSGQEFDVDNGEDGDPGQDGVSPAITITQTSTGHKVKITDRDHPSGQEFNVEDGEDGDPGPGVPPGGSAGQFYRKASGTDYDGEWHTLSAGDSSYDSSLTYASGTVGKELSSQRNTLNQLDGAKAAKVDLTNINQTSPNCTVTNGIAKGTYFYLDGVLTRAIEAISENAQFTSSNCEAVTAGGLNDLLRVEQYTATPASGLTFGANTIRKCGNVVTIRLSLYNQNIPTTGVFKVIGILPPECVPRQAVTSTIPIETGSSQYVDGGIVNIGTNGEMAIGIKNNGYVIVAATYVI